MMNSIAAGLGALLVLGLPVAAQAAPREKLVPVSVAAESDAQEPAMGASGRFVAFTTRDPLTPEDTNVVEDVYLRDVLDSRTTLVSVGPDGTAAGGSLPAVSSNGRYVAYAGLAGATYLRDRTAGGTIHVGPAPNPGSGRIDISEDGRFVALTLSADVVPEDRNPRDDIYLWDRTTGKLSVVSAGSDGQSDHPAVSDDGRFVTYRTNSVALTRGLGDRMVVVTDMATRKTTTVSESAAHSPAISGDGRWITYGVVQDIGRQSDVLLWDRSTGTTTTVSVNVDGRPAAGSSRGPKISADGRYVSYWSTARNLVADQPPAFNSLYRWDRTSGRNLLVMSPPDNAYFGVEEADISRDGRFVAFETQSGALVADDRDGRFDVFRADLFSPEVG